MVLYLTTVSDKTKGFGWSLVTRGGEHISHGVTVDPSNVIKWSQQGGDANVGEDHICLNSLS